MPPKPQSQTRPRRGRSATAKRAAVEAVAAAVAAAPKGAPRGRRAATGKKRERAAQDVTRSTENRTRGVQRRAENAATRETRNDSRRHNSLATAGVAVPSAPLLHRTAQRHADVHAVTATGTTALESIINPGVAPVALFGFGVTPTRGFRLSAVALRVPYVVTADTSVYTTFATVAPSTYQSLLSQSSALATAGTGMINGTNATPTALTNGETLKGSLDMVALRGAGLDWEINMPSTAPLPYISAMTQSTGKNTLAVWHNAINPTGVLNSIYGNTVSNGVRTLRGRVVCVPLFSAAFDPIDALATVGSNTYNGGWSQAAFIAQWYGVSAAIMAGITVRYQATIAIEAQAGAVENAGIVDEAQDVRPAVDVAEVYQQLSGARLLARAIQFSPSVVPVFAAAANVMAIAGVASQAPVQPIPPTAVYPTGAGASVLDRVGLSPSRRLIADLRLSRAPDPNDGVPPQPASPSTDAHDLGALDGSSPANVNPAPSYQGYLSWLASQAK